MGVRLPQTGPPRCRFESGRPRLMLTLLRIVQPLARTPTRASAQATKARKSSSRLGVGPAQPGEPAARAVPALGGPQSRRGGQGTELVGADPGPRKPRARAVRVAQPDLLAAGPAAQRG